MRPPKKAQPTKILDLYDVSLVNPKKGLFEVTDGDEFIGEVQLLPLTDIEDIVFKAQAQYLRERAYLTSQEDLDAGKIHPDRKVIQRLAGLFLLRPPKISTLKMLKMPYVYYNTSLQGEEVGKFFHSAILEALKYYGLNAAWVYTPNTLKEGSSIENEPIIEALYDYEAEEFSRRGSYEFPLLHVFQRAPVEGTDFIVEFVDQEGGYFEVYNLEHDLLMEAKFSEFTESDEIPRAKRREFKKILEKHGDLPVLKIDDFTYFKKRSRDYETERTLAKYAFEVLVLEASKHFGYDEVYIILGGYLNSIALDTTEYLVLDRISCDVKRDTLKTAVLPYLKMFYPTLYVANEKHSPKTTATFFKRK